MVGETYSDGISGFLQTNTTRIILALVLLTIIMIITYKFLYPAMYGNPRKELEELLESLKR